MVTFIISIDWDFATMKDNQQEIGILGHGYKILIPKKATRPPHTLPPDNSPDQTDHRSSK
jgi:hypothetical protein